MRLLLQMALECTVCRQNMNNNSEAAIEAALLGHVAYAVCPRCKQVVEDHRDRDYRARVNRWVARRAGIVNEPTNGS